MLLVYSFFERVSNQIEWDTVINWIRIRLEYGILYPLGDDSINLFLARLRWYIQLKGRKPVLEERFHIE